MKMLLPNTFKKVGLVVAPIAFMMWLGIQLGYLDFLLGPWPANMPVRRVLLVTGAFSFLFGMYSIAFSKEKFEDEMIQRIRLESFLFAAYVQLALVFTFFFWTLLIGDIKQGGFELFLIFTILLFWVSYIIRFNYTVHLGIGEWTTE